jgi:hypothetical protein
VGECVRCVLGVGGLGVHASVGHEVEEMEVGVRSG